MCDISHVRVCTCICKVIDKKEDTHAWLAADGCANAVAIYVDFKNTANCHEEELDNLLQSPEYMPHIQENKVQADLRGMEIQMTTHIEEHLTPFLRLLVEFDIN